MADGGSGQAQQASELTRRRASSEPSDYQICTQVLQPWRVPNQFCAWLVVKGRNFAVSYCHYELR